MAMNRPIGKVATCTVIWVMMSGSVRYEKNWLRNDRVTQDKTPKNHILKVHTGRDRSSLLVTVSRTSSIGDSSSSSILLSVVALLVSGASGSKVPMEMEERGFWWCWRSVRGQGHQFYYNRKR